MRNENDFSAKRSKYNMKLIVHFLNYNLEIVNDIILVLHVRGIFLRIYLFIIALIKLWVSPNEEVFHFIAGSVV